MYFLCPKKDFLKVHFYNNCNWESSDSHTEVPECYVGLNPCFSPSLFLASAPPVEGIQGLPKASPLFCRRLIAVLKTAVHKPQNGWFKNETSAIPLSSFQGHVIKSEVLC